MGTKRRATGKKVDRITGAKWKERDGVQQDQIHYRDLERESLEMFADLETGDLGMGS